jgi:signal transduction histidine kinase
MIQHMWNSDIRLHIRTSSDLLAVTCSRIGLQNAILNLVFNARDAMPNGGVVSIVAQEISDGTSSTDVEISVADTGVGMTREVIDRAFNTFFTTKPTGLGGFGLPMVKHFAEGAGGWVEIESESGVGTTVTLGLPAATALSAALASVLGSARQVDSGNAAASNSAARRV